MNLRWLCGQGVVVEALAQGAAALAGHGGGRRGDAHPIVHPADLGNAATYASNNPTTLMQTFGGKYQCLHSFIHPPSCRTLDCEFDCQLIRYSGFDWSRKPQNFNYWTCVCPTEMIGGAMTERELDNYTLNSLLLDLAEAVSRVCWSFPPTNLNLVFEVLNEIAKTQKHLSDLDK